MKKSGKTPLMWLWEFSKKVVTTACGLYVIAFAYALVAGYKAMLLTADTTAICSIITEINETFRVVVGGYMLKAGGENIAKIVTAYMEKGKETKERDNLEIIDINEL